MLIRLLPQETDGLDMENVFGSAKDVLEDLNAMKEDPEAAQDAFDIDPQLISELDKLSQISKSELACRFPSPYDTVRHTNTFQSSIKTSKTPRQ